MNFEDMLILHFEKEDIGKWIQICKKYNHFNKPLPADDYLPLFKKFYSKEFGVEYNKGDLPFDLDEAKILNVFKNVHDKTYLLVVACIKSYLVFFKLFCFQINGFTYCLH